MHDTHVTSVTEILNTITYLKLGGSIITDKRSAETPRIDVLKRLANEIAQAQRENPKLQLIVGHGSGSFGHVVGKRYGTRAGVSGKEQWFGFAATHDAAARLNRLVTSALLEAGVAAWSIQPSVALQCVDGRIVDGPLRPVARALQTGLTPLIYGDVALDDVRGGTIVSTEEIFDWLIERIVPRRIVLVGEVDGVFTADPQLDSGASRIPLITSTNFAEIMAHLGASHGFDVTGGMAAKVQQSLAMAKRIPHLQINICSGLVAGNVHKLLSGESPQIGTLICDKQSN